MYEQCPVCGFTYEREEGYFTGAWALNLVISELLVAAFIVPVAAMAGMNPNIPLIPLVLIGAPLPFVLPVLFFRHSRGLWMCIDHLLNPVPKNRLTANVDY